MTKRLTYIDVTNIMGIIGVLFIHSSWVYTANTLGTFDAIVRTICAPAVFFFLMNSGATLLDYRKKYSTKIFFKKRILRVGVPFLVWSIIYYIANCLIKNPLAEFNFLVKHGSVINFISSFLQGNINAAFWFFYCIITLYLLTPVLSLLVDHHKDVLLYIVILAFVFDYIIIYFNNQVFHLQLDTFLFPFTSTNYIAFFIMGYLIKSGYFKDKINNIFVILSLISLIFSIFLAFNFLNPNIPPFVMNMKEYRGPVLFFYVIGLYIFIKYIIEHNKFFNRHLIQVLFAKLSSVSLGIYILHLFFLQGFQSLTNTGFNNWIDILIMPMLTYILCGSLVYILKKLPFIKDILP